MFHLYRVSGQSMEPTYPLGCLVLAEDWSYRHRHPRVGEVVVAYPFFGWMALKRVVSRAGPWEWNLEGDNPDESVDSRVLGAVPEAYIHERVLCRLGRLRLPV